MPRRPPVVITLFASYSATGDLEAHAVPNPAFAYSRDTIVWKVRASGGVNAEEVRPAHVRLKGTSFDAEPFITSAPERTRRGFVARTVRGGLTRIYKYDIMVGKVIAADPDIQIKDEGEAGG